MNPIRFAFGRGFRSAELQCLRIRLRSLTHGICIWYVCPVCGCCWARKENLLASKSSVPPLLPEFYQHSTPRAVLYFSILRQDEEVERVAMRRAIRGKWRWVLRASSEIELFILGVQWELGWFQMVFMGVLRGFREVSKHFSRIPWKSQRAFREVQEGVYLGDSGHFKDYNKALRGRRGMVGFEGWLGDRS